MKESGQETKFPARPSLVFRLVRRGRCLHRPDKSIRFYGNLRRIRWCPMGRCGHQPLRVGFEDSVGKRGTLESIRNQRTLRDQTFGVRCFSFLRRWAKVVHWDLPKYGQTETEDTMKWKTKRKAVPAERDVPRALSANRELFPQKSSPGFPGEAKSQCLARKKARFKSTSVWMPSTRPSLQYCQIWKWNEKLGVSLYSASQNT